MYRLISLFPIKKNTKEWIKKQIVDALILRGLKNQQTTSNLKVAFWSMIGPFGNG